MYTSKDLPVVENEVATVADKDRPHAQWRDKDERKAKLAKQSLEREGTGANVENAGTWKTQITWDPVHGPSEDGTGVTCTVLGPDHACGDGPSKDIGVCPNALTLTNAFGNHIKGHLLNANLGGPGDDSRNLAAIPETTNSAMSSQMEENLKSIVNKHRAWIYYQAKVEHKESTKKGHWYASKISCTWWQLEEAKGAPQKLDSTEGKAVFTIPDPASKTAATFKVTAGKSPDTPDKRAAKTVAPWNAIVLTSWSEANKMKDAFNFIEPIIDQLKAKSGDEAAQTVGTELATALAMPPSPKETSNLTWLKTELTALVDDPKRPCHASLKATHGEYQAARKERINVSMDTFKAVLVAHELKGVDCSKLEKILGDNDPLAVYGGLLDQCLSRLDASATEIAQLKDQNAALQRENEALKLRLAQGAGATSPSDPDKDQSMPALDRAATRKRGREDAAKAPSEDGKAQRVVEDAKPAHSGDLLFGALGHIKQNVAKQPIPDAFGKLAGVDASLHGMVDAYVKGTGLPDGQMSAAVSEYAATPAKQATFVEYLLGMQQIAEFKGAFEAAGAR